MPNSSRPLAWLLLAGLAWFDIRASAAAEAVAWPPALKGAKDGTVSLRSPLFLQVPPKVEAARKEAGAAAFTVARVAPTVDLAFHRDLGKDAVNRRLWSSWGDICVASDGRVYCAIGDHGDDAGGDARCLIYCWDPKRKVLRLIVNMAGVLPPQKGLPAWSKVHARIDEGPDGKIYFSCTLNDGNRAGQEKYRWTKEVPGGQLYQYDPRTGKTVVFANLPPRRCTATSILDRDRNVWWCNLESGGNALWCLDLATKKERFKAPDGSTGFNRNFALGRDGAIYFNGQGSAIWQYDPIKKRLQKTGSTFTGSPGMRSSTHQAKDGSIYGTTQGNAKTGGGQLFRYRPAQDELKLLGPAWLRGDYVTVSVLSPDERFVYYLPGAHGGAVQSGTPVIQYEVATGQRKVIAFLAEAFEKEYGYIPAGTYGAKLSADGGTLYVNFNGHAADRLRPKHMRPNGFGLCAFAAIPIPAEERRSR